jgi:colanic acid/amylovoran biosynthesis glycosyltransferase
MTVGYLLKMFPRFSETFVLAELLELERQGVDLRVISLKRPDDGIVHDDVSRLRAPVTYVPEALLPPDRAVREAHRWLVRRDRRRYAAALRAALARRRLVTLKHFVRAGFVARELERHGIGHVHAHFASTATSVALHVHRLTGASFSFTAHAKDIYRHAVDRPELALKLRTARFAVTVTDYNSRWLRTLENGGNLVRIYNGLDLGRFRPNSVPRAEPPLLLGVGRLVEKKGFDDLVRACARLRERGLEFRCLIVGKGPAEEELRELAARLEVDDRLELAGPSTREQLLALYRRASVVVAPCVVGRDGNRDGLPTVVLEAMALGVPVVATDVTGMREAVRDGETGLLVPQRQPEALASAIERVLAGRAEAERLAGAARELVAEEFDLRRNVSVLRGLLEEAAA